MKSDRGCCADGRPGRFDHLQADGMPGPKALERFVFGHSIVQIWMLCLFSIYLLEIFVLFIHPIKNVDIPFLFVTFVETDYKMSSTVTAFASLVSSGHLEPFFN